MIRVAICFLLLVFCCQAQQKLNQAFERAYKYKIWQQNGGPLSGRGSDPCGIIDYLLLLQNLIDREDITKIVEIGYGDFEIDQHLILEDKQYVGYEVVESMSRQSKDNTNFFLIKSLAEVGEEGDLIILKDVLHHWPDKDIQYFIKNILPRFKYGLITGDMMPAGSKRVDVTYANYSPIPVDRFPHSKTIFTFKNPSLSLKSTILFTNPM